MTEPRDFDLGRQGEAAYQRLLATYGLSRRFGFALVLSEARAAREEVRARLERVASQLVAHEPDKGALPALLRLAGAADAGESNSPVFWIDAGDSALNTWRPFLAAANRERENLGDAGRSFLIFAGPEELGKLVREGAPDLWALSPPVLRFEASPTRLLAAGRVAAVPGPIDWLHLSDLHLGRCADWREDTVLNHFHRDVPGLLREAGLQPQLVFVTGDLAWSGQAQQYDLVHTFLSELLERLGLQPGASLFLVPGNHDVDRGAIGRGTRLAQAELLAKTAQHSEAFREAVGDILGSAQELEPFGRRLAAYCAFTGRLLGPARRVSPDRPFRTDVRELGGVAVGVASLSSAWLCGPDDDRKGRIVLGERQVRDLLKELDDEGAAFRILLLHHPLEWLHEAEDRAVRELLQAEADLVLHGHLHEVDLTSVRSPFGRAVIAAAGATYAGADFANGFQAARFDPSSGLLTQHLFKYVRRGGGAWKADHDLGTGPRAALPTVALRRLVGAEVIVSGNPEGGLAALGARLKQAVLRVYGSIDFVGLADNAPKPRTQLEDLYVPAVFELLEGFARSDAGPRRSLAELEAQLLVPATEATEIEPRRCVVLGDPGSGKSTLILHLALAAAQQPAAPVPVVLKLREYVRQQRRDGLLMFAADECRELLQVPTSSEQLAALAQRGELLLLVDGLDEVVDEHDRSRARDLLTAFSSGFPRAPVLATSRVVGYSRAPLPREAFMGLRLQPFDDDEIRRFLERWYHVALPDDPRERERRTADLLAALEREPRAKALARVPLLSTLIALVHRFEASLPGERATLYDLCVKTLVVTWPRARGRRFASLNEFLQRAVLEQLALRLQERRGAGGEADVTIGTRELVGVLTEIFGERGLQGSVAERQGLAERWVDWLRADAGLVVEQQPGVFGFLHLSLLEFLAGRAVLEREGRRGDAAVAEFIVRRHDTAHWCETCLLALGSESMRRNLVDATTTALLLRAREPEASRQGWPSWVFLLALLREEVDVRPEARREILLGAAQAAVGQRPGAWSEARARLSDVLVFGRLHGPATREILTELLLGASGGQLAGVAALCPDELALHEVLSQRAERARAVASLLDFLPTHPAGRWAWAEAGPSDVLAWARACPAELAGVRTLVWLDAHSKHGAACSVLVGSVGEWRSAVVQHLAPGVAPAGARRETAALKDGLSVPLQPSWVVIQPSGPSAQRDGGTELAYGFARDFARGFADDFADDFARDFARGFARDFACDLARVFARGFAGDFAREFADDFADAFEGALPLSPAPRDTPQGTLSSTELEGPWQRLSTAKTKREAQIEAQSIVAFVVSHARAGGALAAAAELDEHATATLVSLSRQDARLCVIFDPFAQFALGRASSPRDPTTIGLLLALAFRQNQTTGRWPWGKTFADLVREPAPEHWFPAYWWHSVHAMGADEPARADAARAAADACLERSDWPELAAELRKYRFVRTPPEIAARFGTGE